MYFIQRHPLEDLLSSLPPEPGANHLTVLLRPTVCSVLAASGQERMTHDALNALEGVSVRFCGPSEWLLISDEVSAQTLGRSLSVSGLRWVDQSHAYVVVRLSGPNARSILAKGVGADLHPDAFPVGHAANALCGQVQVNLACVGHDTFTLAAPRSYASFFFQDLMLAGREFALTAAFEAST